MRPPPPLGSTSMKLLLAPWAAGLSAARHLHWYVSYQITGEARPDSADSE